MSRAQLPPMRMLQVRTPASPRVPLVLASPRVPSCLEMRTARTRTLCVSSSRGLQVPMGVMQRVAVVLCRRLCRRLSHLLLQLLLKSADLGGCCVLFPSRRSKYLLNLNGSAFALLFGLMVCILQCCTCSI